MIPSEKILELARENQGYVTSEMVNEAGISRGSLKYLVDMGKLEKTGRGSYVLPDRIEDEFLDLQTRFKKGVFSLETALFLLGLTDRTPSAFQMTFPGTYNLTGAKKMGVDCHNANEEFYALGIVERPTPFGNVVRTYSPEKTLCDILRPRNHVDVQSVSNAYKMYVASSERNIPLLSEYAEKLGVEERVRHYLEVLL